MSLHDLAKSLRADRCNLTAEANKILTAAATAKRSMTGEENQKFEAIHADIDAKGKELAAIEKQIDAERALGTSQVSDDRLSTIVNNTPTQPGGNPVSLSEPTDPAEVAKLERRTMIGWMRHGLDGLRQVPSMYQRAAKRMSMGSAEQAMTAAIAGGGNLGAAEERALSALSTSGTAGGYTVPQDFQRELDVALKYYGGMLEASRYIDTDNGQLLPFPSINDTANSATLTTENTLIDSTTDPVFGVINLSAYMYPSSIIRVPFQLLEDSAFNIEAELIPQLAIRIGRALNYAFTKGDGSSKPKGIASAVTQTVTATGGLLYGGTSAAATTSVGYGDLIALEHAVDPAYRPQPGVGWMMHDTTLSKVRKLVDSQNRPIFLPGGYTGDISKKAPDTINGYQYWINNDLDAVAAGVRSVYFGAFKKYIIRRVKSVQMVRFSERYADYLQIGLMCYLRADGNLQDAGTYPIKALVHPTA